jgi:hypothetical protein
MNVVEFPRRYRHPLPPDAFPWKGRHCVVHPYEGKWAYYMSDEGGGAAEHGLTRHQAISAVLEWVLEDDATLTISDVDPSWSASC